MLYQPLLKDENPYFLMTLNKTGGFQIHWHYEIEILYCLHGMFNVQLDEQTYTVEQSEYIIISSTIAHNFTPVIKETVAVVVEFGSTLLGNNINDFLNCVFEVKPSNVNIKSNLDKIISIVDSSITCDKLLIKSCLFAIASIMLKEINHTKIYPSKKDASFKRISLIQPVLEYVAKSYADHITLDTVTKLTHYETKSFSNAFKAATGMSFHQYLNSYRINQACRLLNTAQYNIGQVGVLCGISQAKSFSRIFRQYTKMTPTEYINRNL